MCGCGIHAHRYVYDGDVGVLQAVLEQGGIQPGGLNFDCKVRRESSDVNDMFIAHIGQSVTLVWVTHKLQVTSGPRHSVYLTCSSPLSDVLL